MLRGSPASAEGSSSFGAGLLDLRAHDFRHNGVPSRHKRHPVPFVPLTREVLPQKAVAASMVPIGLRMRQSTYMGAFAHASSSGCGGTRNPALLGPCSSAKRLSSSSDTA